MNDDYIYSHNLLKEMVPDKTKSVKEIAKATGYSPGYISKLRLNHKRRQEYIEERKAKEEAEALAEENRIKALIEEAVAKEREKCVAIVEDYVNTFRSNIWPGSEILVDAVKNREEVA